MHTKLTLERQVRFASNKRLRLAYIVVVSIVILTIPTNSRGNTSSAQREEGNTPAEAAVFSRVISEAKAAMLSDPVKARSLGHGAREQANSWPKSIASDIDVATAGWIEGEGAYRSNDIAASKPLIINALALAERVAPKSKLNADLLLSLARIREEEGQPQEALEASQRAYNIFVMEQDRRSQAKALQSIGSIYQDAQDYKKLLYYYKLAEETFPNDAVLTMSANNNIATALYNLGNFRQAQVAYNNSLRIAKRMGSSLLEAQILGNISNLATENHNYLAAENAVTAGLKLTAKPAARSWRPTLLGVRAKLDFAQGDLAAAQRHLAEAFAQASDATADQSFSAVHLTAYRVYKFVGNDARALEHLEAFRRIDDEGRKLAASTNAALMTARFDFVNQNARIAALKAGQLARDVALTRVRARQSTVLFSGVLALLLTVVLFLFVYLRSVRRNRSEIARTNDRLAQTNSELGEALDAKSQFLATTSHEIRTPLNGILGMTQVILADNAVGGLVRDRIALVDSAGRAMRTLVDDILDFAKMDSGAVRLDRAPTELTIVMPQLVSLWRAQAHDKGIGLRLTMTGVEVPLMTDAARLRQVVFNLLSNAIKFTAAGEIAVEVSVENGIRAPFVVIAVSDTGIGVPSDSFETIFEPFRQLDTSTTRQFGGTGLGLAISRHLARVLGGDITVNSGASGSTFTLRLPFVTGKGVESAVVPSSHAALIVSDNRIRRSYLRTALERDFGSSATCGTRDVAEFMHVNSARIVIFDLDDEATGANAATIAALATITKPRPLIVLAPPPHAAETVARPSDCVARLVIKPIRIDALIAILREIDCEETGSDADATSQAMAITSDLP